MHTSEITTQDYSIVVNCNSDFSGDLHIRWRVKLGEWKEIQLPADCLLQPPWRELPPYPPPATVLIAITACLVRMGMGSKLIDIIEQEQMWVK